MRLTLLSLLSIVLVSCSLFASSYCQIFTRPEYRPQNVINSFLTPILPRSECFTSADNRAGLCMPRAACVSSGGLIVGTCGLMSACCIYQGSCRAVVTANETYFVSPNYPNLVSERLDPPVCIFTLQRNNLIQKWPICQIRLDFDEFSLAPPVNGSCGGLTDAFVMSGASNFNASGLPETGICGELSGQHLYVNVDPDDSTEPLLLVVTTANEQTYARKWSIRIRQVPCQSPFKAPPGCLQYFTSGEGMVESFNLRGMTRPRPFAFNSNPFNPNQQAFDPFSPNQPLQQQQLLPSPNYFTGLNYGICVSQQPKTCGIRWEAMEFDFGGPLPDVSGVGSVTGTNVGCVVSSQGAGFGSSDIGDYILIPGASRDGVNGLENRFCGQKLNPVSQQNMNVPLVSFFKPFVMFVKTDSLGSNALNGAQNQKGFQIKYKLINC